MQAGEVREMPAARPYLDRGRRQVLAEPLPVAEHDLLVWPAGRPDQFCRGWRQELGVEAVVEHLPDGRELRATQTAGQRLPRAARPGSFLHTISPAGDP